MLPHYAILYNYDYYFHFMNFIIIHYQFTLFLFASLFFIFTPLA